MTRLPTVGGDDGNWGAVLNQFLQAAHNSDGTIKNLFANVMDYGAKGDGTTDDTAAIQAAVASGLPVWFPKPASKYIITSTIDLRNHDGLTFFGDDPQNTIIQQNTDNIPMLQIGGERQCIRGLRLQYKNDQPNTNTNANAIEIWHLFESVIDRMYFFRVGTGIFMPVQDAGGGVNTCFSNTISNLRINAFSQYGINLESFNANSTGCLFSNIYINNTAGSVLTATAGFRLKGWDEVVIQQLNVEHGIYARAISLNSVRTAVGNGWHLESVQLSGNNAGFIELVNTVTYLALTGLHVLNNSLLTANGVTSGAGIFKFYDTTANLYVTSMTERNTTINGGITFYQVYSTAATAGSIHFLGTNVTAATTSSLPAAQTPLIKQQTDNFSHLQIGGKNVTSAAAAPTSGTWAVGDIVLNSTPARGTPLLWVCTAAGTPGTWYGVGSSDKTTGAGAGFYGMPSDLLYKAWTIDPRYMASGTGFAAAAGTTYAAKLRTPEAWSSGFVTHQELYVIQAGTGVTPLANCFVGLYRADNLAQIAVSTDQAGVWNTIGPKSITFTTTAAKPVGVDVYAVILVGTQATTNVQFARLSAISASLANGSQLTGNNSLFATADTGASALPATLATLTAHLATIYHGLY